MHLTQNFALDLFTQRLKLNSQKTFITFEGQGFTFEEIFQQASSLANKLKDLGVTPGERVLLRFWNEPNFVIAYFAVLLTGGVAVTISPLLTQNEISHIVNHASARLILAFENTESNQLVRLLSDGIYANSLDLLSSLIQVSNLPQDLAVLIYTSGTTASPKGVMLTYSNIKAQIQAASQVMKVQENDSVLGILSLAHVFGQMDILWLALYGGNTVHLLQRFDAKAALELLTKQQISILIAVPTMYQLMVRQLERNPQKMPRLRVCHSGAAPLSAKLFEEIEKHFGAPIQEGYGLTETCSMAFSNPLEASRKTLSVGKTIGNNEFKLLDENKLAISSSNQVGEVCIKGPIISPGYFNAPKQTAKSFTSEGWLLTGDLGYFDEEGYLFLVDRKKDLIIRGGYKVYPREVEEVLLQHPMVQQAAVVGTKSKLSIEKTIAFIVPKCSISEAVEINLVSQLKTLCTEQLAVFKIPNRFELTDSIPTTPSGKLLKRKLEERLLNE